MSKLIQSSGGQIYDRTTGTWAGENQGSFGDGFKHGNGGDADGKVWHDANGISGVEFTRPQASGGGGSGPGSAQVTTAGTSAAGAGGTGPGAAGVVSGGVNAGGKGSGSSLVINAPRMSHGVIDWQTPGAWEEAPEIGGIENKPLKRIGIGGPQEAPGAISDIGWIKTQAGWMVAPSSDAKERIEDDLIQQVGWAWRNQIAPYMGFTEIPFPDFLGNTESWHRYDWVTGEIKPIGVDGGDAGGGGW